MDTSVSEDRLTEWADSCLRINHLNTLVQREIASQNTERARELSERARRRAWELFNTLLQTGAHKPEGYAEPPVSRLADDVRTELQRLVGLRLSRMALAADMRTFQFGAERRRGSGVVGEFALHIQCPWRLESSETLITGYDDLFVPVEDGEQTSESFDYEQGGSLQDKVLRDLLGGYDADTKQIINATDLFTVDLVQTDATGGFRLCLSGGYTLSVFPDGSRREAWRMFKPSTEENEVPSKHFVVPAGLRS